MKTVFDNEGDFVKDMEKVVKDALAEAPSLIVVPTEREIKTFDRNFKDKVTGKDVFCCTFDDWYNAKWMMLNPTPKNVFIFRQDDVNYNLSGRAKVKYMTVRGMWRKDKKEESINEG